MERHVVIVGAGLAGSLLAVFLARQGFRVSVYERRADPRQKGYAGGRSINLALSIRGIDALRAAGLAERIMTTEAIPMRGRMIHPPAPGTGLVFQPYSSNPDDAINSVSRGGLNLALIHAAAELPNVTMYFDHPCLDAELEAPAALFSRPDGSTVRVTADLIVATDGAYSAIRQRMLKNDRFEYSQTYLKHGYKELHIPSAAEVGLSATAHDGYALAPHALHIWPRGSAMMIALPNRDKSFTCTLFWPLRDESADGHGLENLATDEQVASFFARHYPDAAKMMPTLTSDYRANPNGSLVTVRCWPWQMHGKVCLMGDAAHAIVPFYGQGMNCAFEDCKALSTCLAEAGGPAADAASLASALDRYQHLRKPNADAIADMALDNFIEMRDKVGRPAFLHKKRIEQLLHKHFPDRCQPQYNLVSFSTTPYAQAKSRGAALDAICEAVVAQLPLEHARTLEPADFDQRVLNIVRPLLGLGLSDATTDQPPSRLIDISPAITNSTNVWPGDTPFQRNVLMDMAKGDHITLSSITTTVHLGAHADGFNHYGHPAPGVGQLGLHHFIGKARVLEINIARGGRIRPGNVAGGKAALDAIGTASERIVLLRTNTFAGFDRWNSDFAALSVEFVDALAARAVVTIGIDTPSVDLQDSKTMEAHRAILRHNIAILEGLDLSHVAPGLYTLMAAPIRLTEADGSPVRAVLMPE